MGFTAPGVAEFDACAAVMGRQGANGTALAQFATTTCANTQGLENLLGFLAEPVASLAGFMAGEFSLTARGLAGIADRLRASGARYAQADAAADADVRRRYPAVPGWFPELPASAGPTLDRTGQANYDDAAISLDPPPEAQDLIAAKLRDVSGALGAFEGIWQYLTGESLLALLVEPIVGNYGRLEYLQQAYGSLSDQAYLVADNERRATLRMSTRWDGEAAAGFEATMFRWHQGTGGLGDLAAVAAQTFGDAWSVVSETVNLILGALDSLIAGALASLAKAVAKVLLIEAAGLGPEDPVADVIAAISAVHDMYKALKAAVLVVKAIIFLINKLAGQIQGIADRVHRIATIVSTVHDLVADPSGTTKDLLSQGAQTTVDLEHTTAWDPVKGAVRIALLPQG